MNYQYKYDVNDHKGYFYRIDLRDKNPWNEACDNPELNWKRWITRTYNNSPDTEWLREADEVKYLCAKLDAVISGEEDKYPQVWRTKKFRAFYNSDDDWGIVTQRNGAPVRVNKEKLLPRSFGARVSKSTCFELEISENAFNSILRLG